MHDAVGVDVCDALRHHLGLIPADGRAQRDELAVEVRLAHHVVVHKGQLAHARARERFGNKAAYAAHAEYGHMRAGKTRKRVFSQQHNLTFKLHAYLSIQQKLPEGSFCTDCRVVYLVVKRMPKLFVVYDASAVAASFQAL